MLQNPCNSHNGTRRCW